MMRSATVWMAILVLPGCGTPPGERAPRECLHAVLTLESTVVKRGERVGWELRIVNDGNRSVAVAECQRSWNAAWLYPDVREEVVDAEGTPRKPRPMQCGGTFELIAKLRTTVLSPGALSEASTGLLYVDDNWLGGCYDLAPGRYSLRVTYDASAARPADWLRCAEDLSKAIAAELDGVYHGRLVSDWVEFTVQP